MLLLRGVSHSVRPGARAWPEWGTPASAHTSMYTRTVRGEQQRSARATAATQAPPRHRVIRVQGRKDVVLTTPVQVASVPGRGQRVSSRGTRARLGPMETTRRASRADLLDPAVVASLGRLEIVARWIVDGFMSGLHRSPRKGFSVEFAEYRPYQPGDDLRFVDWKIAARSDRWVVRQYEEETNLRATLVL